MLQKSQRWCPMTVVELVTPLRKMFILSTCQVSQRIVDSAEVTGNIVLLTVMGTLSPETCD